MVNLHYPTELPCSIPQVPQNCHVPSPKSQTFDPFNPPNPKDSDTKPVSFQDTRFIIAPKRIVMAGKKGNRKTEQADATSRNDSSRMRSG